MCPLTHADDVMYLFTTVPHPHGHWQLQELLGNAEQDNWPFAESIGGTTM